VLSRRSLTHMVGHSADEPGSGAAPHPCRIIQDAWNGSHAAVCKRQLRAATSMTAACPHFGFTVDITLAPGLSEAEAVKLRQQFLSTLDASGMTHATSERAMWRYVVSRDAGQATNADREAIAAWAAAHAVIASCRIGDLIDLRD